MEYKLIKTGKDLLYFEVIGNYSQQEGERIIKELHNRCVKGKISKILVDITKKDGNIPVLDRFFFGTLIAKLFSYKIKMAVIGKKDQVTRFSEVVASNRGARLGIFREKKEAIKWLKV